MNSISVGIFKINDPAFLNFSFSGMILTFVAHLIFQTIRSNGLLSIIRSIKSNSENIGFLN
jgi:hypothetical protein